MSRSARRPGAVRRPAAVQLAVALTTVLVAIAVNPAPSIAGEYHVYSCRVPRGEHAGTPEAVHGTEAGSTSLTEWTYSAKGIAQAGNTCDDGTTSSGEALVASLPAGLSHSSSDASRWTFTAPTGETITNATLWRAGDADGGEGYVVWLASPTDSSAKEALGAASTFGACSWLAGCEGVGNTRDPLSPENEVKVPAANLPSSHLYVNASCSRSSCPGGEGDELGYAAVAHLYAADIVLEDPTPPKVTEVSGGLAADATLSGEAHLRFKASDAGSGVFEATVSLDGKVLHRGVIDEGGGRCKPLEVLPEGDPVFLYAQPCPASASAEVSLSSSGLANGAHSLLVQVSDAAGNQTVVLKRTIDVANPTPTGSSAQPGTGSESSTGQRTPTGGPTGGSAALKTVSASTPGRPNGIDPSPRAVLRARWLRRRAGTHRSRRRAAGRHPARSSRHHRGGRKRHRGHHHRSHRGRHTHHHHHSRHGRHARRRHSHAHHHAGTASRLTGRFGAAETIAGRLAAPGGRPIAQAILEVTETPAYGGARPRTLRAVQTGATGRFHLRLPARLPSSRIRLSYASRIGGRPTTSTTLALAVRASLTLHVHPHRTSAGQEIRLSGTIHGGHIPAGGKQVILEARSKGTPWLQFRVLRTGRNGHFAATHRFRLAGPVRYRFRAVCPAEADFPFSTGTSKPVGVFER